MIICQVWSLSILPLCQLICDEQYTHYIHVMNNIHVIYTIYICAETCTKALSQRCQGFSCKGNWTNLTSELAVWSLYKLKLGSFNHQMVLYQCRKKSKTWWVQVGTCRRQKGLISWNSKHEPWYIWKKAWGSGQSPKLWDLRPERPHRGLIEVFLDHIDFINPRRKEAKNSRRSEQSRQD